MEKNMYLHPYFILYTKLIQEDQDLKIETKIIELLE